MLPTKHPRIMITGLSGVGKTHLIAGLRDQYFVSVFEFGKEMGLLLKAYTGNAEQPLATVPLANRQEIQRRIIRRLEDKADDTPVVIDGHLLVEQGNTSLTVPGLPGDDYKRMDLDGIILICDDPRNIIARRAKNTAKYQALCNQEKFIEETQSLYRQVACTYSILFGCFFASLDLREFSDLEQSDPVWAGPRLRLEKIVGDIIKSIKGA